MAKTYEEQGLTYAEYHAIHVWLREKNPLPKKCAHCGYQGSSLEQALIHGKRYERNPENFIGLCTRCHRRYDIGGDPQYITEPIRTAFKELSKFWQLGDSVKVSKMTGISYERVHSIIAGGTIMTIEHAAAVLIAYTQLIKSREKGSPHIINTMPSTAA